MRTRFLLHATVACTLAAPAATALADVAPLAAERWKTRPLVLVVPRADDPLLARVNRTLAQATGREAFREREMVLYTVVAGSGTRNGEPLHGPRTQALLTALELKPDGPAMLVLVGKDGGVKMREGADADLNAVFAEIDRMPMRQPR